MNGSRLTLFDNLSCLGVPALPAGMVSGAVGGGIGSPFYLLKTQQQALSSLNVGSQHKGTKNQATATIKDQRRTCQCFSGSDEN